MQSLQKILEEEVRKEKRRARFTGNIKVVPFSNKPHFKAHTHMVDKTVLIRYNPKYEEKSEGKSRVVVGDIAKHEINYHQYEGFKGCPRNSDNHFEKFIVPVSRVLMPEGYTEEDVRYIANALEDTILHKDLNKGFSLEGIASFFEDVGESNNNEFTEFYEAHVKLNMFLWGNKKQKKRLSHLYKHYEEVKETITNFLERTKISEMRDENGNYDKEIIREYLTNEENWEEMAKIYAEEFKRLLKPGYAIPLINHSGAGTKGREDEDSESEGNVFDKEIRSKEFKEGKIWDYYQKAKKGESNESLPPLFDSFEALDLLYQRLAKQLRIKAESRTISQKFDYTSIGKEPFDPQKHKLKRLTFGFDDNGKPILMRKKHPLYIDINVKKQNKGIPEARYIMLDTSDSMKDSPEGGSNIGNTAIIPWGDNSKYHYALLGWYGFLNYLKNNHLLEETSITLANFSNDNYIGKGLRKAKKVALKPQFGLTNLYEETVNEMFKERGALVYTISDGIIDTWNDIREDFIEKAKRHHYFHLQIGGKNNFTEDLERAGLNVYYVKGNEDLANLVIDLTKNVYKRGDQ